VPAEKIELGFVIDTNQIAGAKKAIGDLGGAIDKAGDRTRIASDKTSRFGMVAFQAGQAAQDFAIGLERSWGHAIMYAGNNISFLAQMLGVGGALGIGIQVATTGVMILSQNWDKLSGVFEESKPRFRVASEEVERLNKELKDLEARAAKDPDAYRRLTPTQQAATVRADIEQHRRSFATEGDPQAKWRGGAAMGAFEGEDLNQIARQLGGRMMREGPVGSAETQKKLAEARGELAAGGNWTHNAQAPVFIPYTDAEKQAMQTRIMELEAAKIEEAMYEAQNMIAAAMAGRGGNLHELIRLLESIGRHDLADRLRESLQTASRAKLKAQVSRNLGWVGRAMNGLRSPNVTAVTQQESEAIGSSIQQRMEGAGLSAGEQGAVAQALSGKKIIPALQAVPFFLNAMAAVDATEREIFQLMPEFLREVEGGANPMVVAQKMANKLVRAGMAQSNRQGRRSGSSVRNEAMARLGAQMLGINPNINPDAMSRLGDNGTNFKIYEKNSDALNSLAQQLEQTRRTGIRAILGSRR
jgi:hypothetical protein